MASSASAPRLFDASGVEIPLDVPPPSDRAQMPAPVSADARDRFRSYPSKNLTPNKVVAILEEADGGDPLRLIELIEEMIEKDGKIESVLRARTAAIQGLNWEIEPAQLEEQDLGLAEQGTEIADFCDHALVSANFRELVGDVMDARVKPFAVDWITWGRNRRRQIVPTRFKRIPTTHIRWAFDKDEIRLWQPSKPVIGRNGDIGEPVEPYTTVRAIDLSRRDHPTRAGLGRTLLWPYQFKSYEIKDMVAAGERFGMGVRILRIEEKDFDNPERYRKFRQAVKDMGTDASGVISKNADFEIKELSSGKGFEIFVTSIDYFDKWIAWKVLGHELSSQSAPGQGQLGITAAMDVRQDIKEDDCEWISEILRRDVLVPMVAWNFGWDVVRAGLVPYIRFDYELPRDMSMESQVLDRVLRLFPSLPVSKQKIRADYRLPAPIGEEESEAQDDVLRSGVGGEAAAADASGADDPSIPDDEDPDADPATVNGARAHGALITTLATSDPQPVEEKQEPVDELADRGIAAAAVISEKWATQIRAVLLQAAEDGIGLAEARKRIIALYPELDVAGLEESLRQKQFLVRMFGRNA